MHIKLHLFSFSINGVAWYSNALQTNDSIFSWKTSVKVSIIFTSCKNNISQDESSFIWFLIFNKRCISYSWLSSPQLVDPQLILKAVSCDRKQKSRIRVHQISLSANTPELRSNKHDFVIKRPQISPEIIFKVPGCSMCRKKMPSGW